MTDFKSTFAPKLDALADARNWVEKTLPVFARHHNFTMVSEDTIGTMILCLSEMMANTIDYARPSATKIIVGLKLQGNKIHIEIEDDGAPFLSFQKAIEAARHAHDEPTLDERGRGLYLVGNLCSELDYQEKKTNDNSYNKTVLIYDTHK